MTTPNKQNPAVYGRSIKLQFTVIGHPEPAGSKRAFPFKRRDGKLGVAVSDANPRAKHWKQAVACIAADEMAKLQLPVDRPLLDGPLKVWFRIRLSRPKGHYRSGAHSSELKPSAPVYPTTRPDLLKIARGVEDACTGIIWVDDSQIVGELLEKAYGAPERVEIEIETLTL